MANNLHILRFHLSEFSLPKFRLQFGIGGQQVTAFSKPDLEKKPEKVTSTSTS